ncbi:MAG: substrate-binding domain-containing protein [Bacillota bacterium]
MYRCKRVKPLTLFVMTLLLSTALIVGGCAEEELIDDTITLATTTSTYDSGLLDFLNPIFTEETGLEVEVVSQGTGAALETGKRGDVDVLLVHDRGSELELVEEGHFVDRYDVMYNDFIFVGAEEDPAGVKGMDDALDALNLIADHESTFVSRGDDSGTHRMEMRLWKDAGLNPEGKNWYSSIGQGMGDTLNMANEELGYAMTDRGTYVAMSDNLDLVIVLEGDPALYNQYGIMAVNPDEHPHVKYDYAMIYIEFLMSDKGQELIKSYQVNNETLFFPGYGLE